MGGHPTATAGPTLRAVRATAELDATWVDLVDVPSGGRILLVGDGRSHVAAQLAEDGAEVVSRPRPEDAPGRFAWGCLDGVAVSAALLARVADRLDGDEARLVVVVDNLRSPLRAWDRLGRRSHRAATAWSMAGLHRQLESAGLRVEQHFALLRSSERPVTGFDVLTESAVRTVVAASGAHVHGLRGRLLRGLSHRSPAFVATMAPGWLVIAGRPDRPCDPLRVVGKVSNRDSAEAKLVRGDPAAVLEKRYHGTAPAAEIQALRELEAVGFGLAPRLIGAPDPHRTLITWLPGRPLVVPDLDDEALVTWVGRAAEVLTTMQRLTERDDGTVLVHGDLWLGNLLTDRGAVSGVVDWTQARRGTPDTDRRFLVDSLVAALAEEGRASAGLLARLVAARDAVCPPLT